MRFFFLIALVVSVVEQAGLSRIEHQRVRQMLVSIKNEIRKNYYDPAFRGMDIEQHFKAAEAKLEEATSLGHAMAIIAQSLLDFDDSHLFFFPPNRTATVDYGWVMQMIGNDCYIVAVRPGSDAEKKGLSKGTRVLAIEGFKPTRQTLWKMEYHLYSLSPRPALRVAVQVPGQAPRELDVIAKVTQGKRVIDLTDPDGGDLEHLIREAERDARVASHRYLRMGSTVIWKMPGFNYEPNDMDNTATEIRVLPAVLIAAALAAPAPVPSWTVLKSGVTARLRGVSASSAHVVWASGTDGTVIRTEDAGQNWVRLNIPETEKLDFRDIDAIDDRTAYVLSIGPGDASRIYKTSDAGKSWALQFRNAEPKAFYDAMAFRDERRGFAFSDSVDNTFVIVQTNDGGNSWNRVPTSALPPALPGEGAYAASGTNVVVRRDLVWIATTASRVLRSTDGGRSWTIAKTPLASGPSAGIFSIAFRDAQHGIVVGGDFKKEAEAIDNAAVTDSGGRDWIAVGGLSGYRSAVAYAPAADRTVVAVGPSGTDVSFNAGRSWIAVPGPRFHAVSFAPRSRVAWGVGENGAVGRLGL